MHSCNHSADTIHYLSIYYSADTMLIVNQVRPRHEGVYQCIIKNSLGGVTASARLSIADDDEAELRTKVVDQMQGIAPDMESM
jgi:hypothetical protein